MWGFSVWAHNQCFDHHKITDEAQGKWTELQGLRRATHEDIKATVSNLAHDEGVVYFVHDRRSGELLKVGMTGRGQNAESRFSQYRTWQDRERVLLGKDIEVEYLVSKAMKYDRASILEAEVRLGIDNGAFAGLVEQNPTLRWDWSVDRMTALGITSRSDQRLAKPALYSHGSKWKAFVSELVQGNVMLPLSGTEPYTAFLARLQNPDAELSRILYPKPGRR